MICLLLPRHPKPEFRAGGLGTKHPKSDNGPCREIQRNRCSSPSPTAGAENLQSLNPQLRSSCGSLCFVQVSSLSGQRSKLVEAACVNLNLSTGIEAAEVAPDLLVLVLWERQPRKISSPVTGSYRLNDIQLEPGRTQVGRVALSPHSWQRNIAPASQHRNLRRRWH